MSVKKSNHPEKEPKGKTVGDDTAGLRMVREIEKLAQIPEIEDFFSEVLTEVKKRFPNKIKHLRKLKANLEAKKEDVISGYSNDLSKSKTYFFQLSRVKDPNREFGHKWELEKIKFKDEKDILNIILSNFLEKIGHYETDPNQIQTEIVDLSDLGRSFQISFTKSSDTRVVGFIKEIQKNENIEENVVVQNNRYMVKGKPKSLQLEAEKIQSSLFHLIEENPEFTKYLLFYFLMTQK
ncbi:MAG: hypothetical protein GTN82_12890 [Candidatus Aminicenantes bacterium]|nr:hypothetical protein [Candidatus Aminicenantes bacterium]